MRDTLEHVRALVVRLPDRIRYLTGHLGCLGQRQGWGGLCASVSGGNSEAQDVMHRSAIVSRYRFDERQHRWAKHDLITDHPIDGLELICMLRRFLHRSDKAIDQSTREPHPNPYTGYDPVAQIRRDGVVEGTIQMRDHHIDPHLGDLRPRYRGGGLGQDTPATERRSAARSVRSHVKVGPVMVRCAGSSESSRMFVPSGRPKCPYADVVR